MTPEELNNPLWRLQNLYWIKSEDEGRELPFEPRAEQELVIRSLIDAPEEPLYIIKSRRLGMSTAIGLLMADTAAWNEGFQGSLVDQTQGDAERKMSEIIRYGVLSLPKEIVERYEFPKQNDGELQIKVKGEDMKTASRIFAGKNARGGNNNMLWISEWGPIAAQDPKRSNEIRTGALPSARRGRKVVETTWYGGKGGDLWELIKPILEKDPNAAGRVLFFPWHGDPACVKATGCIDGELETYFRELGDRLGKTFTQDQKRWYASAKIEQGIFVKREYPSTLEEAMTAPVQGAIYGELITRLQAMGSIRPSHIDNSALVHTFWDKGSPVNTVVWYAQFVGPEIRLIDCDVSTVESPLDLTPVERVARMLAKGYNYGWHYLPHDSGNQESVGRSFQNELANAGLRNTRVIPRTKDIWIGINRVRQLMPRMTFRVPACDRGVEALSSYRTKTESMGAMLVDLPVHDWASHPSDALRMLAEAEMHGMIEGGSLAAIAGRQGRAAVVRSGGTRGVRR